MIYCINIKRSLYSIERGLYGYTIMGGSNCRRLYRATFKLIYRFTTAVFYYNIITIRKEKANGFIYKYPQG
jgi:hypothetical protein